MDSTGDIDCFGMEVVSQGKMCDNFVSVMNNLELLICRYC